MGKTVCLAGLGLIGASMAKAIKKYTDYQVYGWNRTVQVTEQAICDGTVVGTVTDEILGKTDLLLVSLFPQASIDYILEAIPRLKKGCIVVDMVGVKTTVVNAIEQAAKEAGVIYIGGHPMAGLAVAGYDNSFADLYQNASMILVPNISSTDTAIEEMSAFFKKLGFGRIMICTREEHDHMIAYTSQLAHVVSNAFVKSPLCEKHVGFSAGSYKDMTRVACLNEKVWQELFLLNSDALLCEIDVLLKHIMDIRNAIEEQDQSQLTELLRIGRERKENFG